MRLTNEKLHIVVLGAGGFLGSATTRHLARLGHNVTAFWRRPNSDLLVEPNVKSVIGDLRDTWTLADAIRDADVVYHFASATHPSMFFANPSAEYWEALQPLMVMMETAARNGVKKIVFPSSGGTIYADSNAPRTEDSATSPRSPYAIFKLTAEQLLLHEARQNHFSVDIFRIGNPYGPDQRPRAGQGVIAHWIDAIKNDKPIKIFGDGTAERDYIYIEDFCELISLSCNRLTQSDTFNLGTGVPVSLRSLHTEFESILNRKIDVEYIPSGSSAAIRSIALNPQHLLAKLPTFSFTPFSIGIAETLKAHRLI